MDVLDSGAKVFKMADAHGRVVDGLMKSPEGLYNPADIAKLNLNVSMMCTYWQLASSLMKDLTEPLKSIVNK